MRRRATGLLVGDRPCSSCCRCGARRRHLGRATPGGGRGRHGRRVGRLVRGHRPVPPPRRRAHPPYRCLPGARTSSARPWATSSRPASSPPTSSPSGCAPPGSCPGWPPGWPTRQRRPPGPPPGRGRGHGRRPAARRRGPPGAGGGRPPPHRDHAAGPAGRQGAGGHDRGRPPPRAARRAAAGRRPVPHRQPGQPAGAASATSPRGGCPRPPTTASSSACSTAPATCWARSPATPTTSCAATSTPGCAGWSTTCRRSPALGPGARSSSTSCSPSPSCGPGSAGVWTDVKAGLRAQAADPDSELRRRLADTLVALGERLRDDPALAGRVEDGVRPASATSPSSSATRSPPWSAARSPAGTAANVRPAGAAARSGPAVHPHQRHRGGRPGRPLSTRSAQVLESYPLTRPAGVVRRLVLRGICRRR